MALSQLNGLVVVNKPKGPTSAGCLKRMKHVLGQKKIGHAGTLDPMATGVLLTLLGQGTKLAPYLTGGDKIYSGKLRLGVATDTYDMEGAVASEAGFEHLRPRDVRDEVGAWKDLREQEVPPISAAKHQGVPLYALARAGEAVPVKVKPIRISHAECLSVDLPWVRFRVRCAAGTYIRSLVHSLGTRLGCGAVLTELTREQCLPFGLEQAHDLDRLLSEPERFKDRVISLREALPHWSRLTLSEGLAEQVRNGAWLDADQAMAPGLTGAPGERAFFFSSENAPLALVESRQKHGRTRWAILRGFW